MIGYRRRPRQINMENNKQIEILVKVNQHTERDPKRFIIIHSINKYCFGHRHDDDTANMKECARKCECGNCKREDKRCDSIFFFIQVWASCNYNQRLNELSSFFFRSFVRLLLLMRLPLLDSSCILDLCGVFFFCFTFLFQLLFFFRSFGRKVSLSFGHRRMKKWYRWFPNSNLNEIRIYLLLRCRRH